MGAGGAFVGMSAARATIFALIAMSTALPSNKILMAAPESNRPKGQLPRHSNTLGHFWLSPEGHYERKTRLKVLMQYRTTAGRCRCLCGLYGPLRPIDSFQNLKKLWVANSAPATPAMDVARACICVF